MIRPAEPADIPAIAALEREALGADAWPEKLVADGVLGGIPTTHYVVATEHAVLGYAVASIVADVAELQRIAVAGDHRRRGLATQLLAEVEEAARIRHADRVLLEVREDNLPALRFYAARGFAELDRRARYYADGTTAVILARDIS